MNDWTPETGTPPASTPDGPDLGVPSLEPAGPAPLGIVRTPTGHGAVDARLERLADADHLPADGHIEVYEDVHRGLRSELTVLDVRPAAVPGPAPTPSHRPHDTHHHTHHDTHHDNRS